MNTKSEKSGDAFSAVSDTDVKGILEAIHSESNYDFSEYSMNSLKRRIYKILLDSRLDAKGLIKKIKEEKAFLELVVKRITVNTTELFRDPKIWKILKDDVLPSLKNHKKINIWHAGASSGQEVYSMLILLNELDMMDQANIYVSDINSDVLSIAREGKYRYRFNQEYLKNFDEVFDQIDKKKKIPYSKYFVIDSVNDSLQVKNLLTEKPVYGKFDLVKGRNPFSTSFDIILCRNVIIYFNYELQNKVFDLFLKNMNDNGILVLGLHESIIGPYASSFNKSNTFYYKK